MKAVLLLALVTFTACGADAPPFVPSASIGANIGPNGVTPQASGMMSNGTISVGLNL